MIKRSLQILLIAFLSGGCRSSILDDPELTIRFFVEQASNVKLTVENSYSTVIATPVDGYKDSGYHSVSIDVSTLPEGLYFYTLECRGTHSGYYFKTTRPIVIVK